MLNFAYMKLSKILKQAESAARHLNNLERPVYKLAEEDNPVSETDKIVREWLRKTPPEGGGRRDVPNHDSDRPGMAGGL